MSIKRFTIRVEAELEDGRRFRQATEVNREAMVQQYKLTVVIHILETIRALLTELEQEGEEL